MSNPVHIGNCSDVIDWSAVITQIKDLPPKKFTLPSTPKSIEMMKMLTDAGYSVNDETIQWINYYPEVHYNININRIFGEFVKHTRYARAWISRVNPGCTVPWHWDVDDNEDAYLTKGTLVRYSCRISPASVGQVTVVGDHALYNDPVGDVYQWADYRQWHGSANSGFVPKYQFNYLGYNDD